MQKNLQYQRTPRMKLFIALIILLTLVSGVLFIYTMAADAIILPVVLVQVLLPIVAFVIVIKILKKVLRKIT